MDLSSLNYTNIVGAKNVKRDNGTAWAFYEDIDMGATINLTFSSKQLVKAEALKPGEIILLYQRVNNIPGTPKELYFTHLVTPVSGSKIDDNNTGGKFRHFRKMYVIARAEPRISIPSDLAQFDFKGLGFGKINDIADIVVNHKDKQVSLPLIQKMVWDKFRNHFVYPESFTGEITDDEIRREFELGDNQEPPISGIEGRTYNELRDHLVRERNPKLVKRAKESAMAKGKGVILCECCDFNFISAYGIHGTGFIECHHKVHIAHGGVRETELKDLAMVCSNCHRMLHRKNQDNHYYTVEQLKNLIAQQNNRES